MCTFTCSTHTDIDTRTHARARTHTHLLQCTPQRQQFLRLAFDEAADVGVHDCRPCCSVRNGIEAFDGVSQHSTSAGDALWHEHDATSLQHILHTHIHINTHTYTQVLVHMLRDVLCIVSMHTIRNTVCTGVFCIF